MARRRSSCLKEGISFCWATTARAGRRFGSNRYAFAVTPVPEYEAFVGLVRKGHLLDASDGKDELRTYLEAHRDEIMNADIDAIPDMFDYRKWFRFQLKVMVENEEGRVIDRKVKSMGSGGERRTSFRPTDFFVLPYWLFAFA